MTFAGYMNFKGDALAEMFGGLPDRIFFGHGPRTVVVEFKRERARRNRRGERRQDYIRDEFARRGYEVYKVKGRAQVERLFTKLTGEKL